MSNIKENKSNIFSFEEKLELTKKWFESLESLKSLAKKNIKYHTNQLKNEYLNMKNRVKNI